MRLSQNSPFLFTPKSPKGDLLNINNLTNLFQGAGGKNKFLRHPHENNEFLLNQEI